MKLSVIILLIAFNHQCIDGFSMLWNARVGIHIHKDPKHLPLITLPRTSRNALLPQIPEMVKRQSSNLLASVESAVSSPKLVYLEAIACAGLTDEEVPIILSAATEALIDHFGMKFSAESIHQDVEPAIPKSVCGATGRVLLLSLNNVADDWDDNDERLDQFKHLLSQRIDSLVGNEIHQPILVSIKPNFAYSQQDRISEIMRNVVHDEAMMYGLCMPMSSKTVINENESSPTIHVEIDGAMVPDPFTKEEVWDTSSILVFDDFIDDSLRSKLLDIVNNREEGYNWDDINHGPDPKRWTRGGLMDVPMEGEPNDLYCKCWGLTEEATNDLCFGEHSAIAELEQKISDLFAADFIVSRLPEAVLGPCVSPLTANAPTFGDSFEYHIDADPNQSPPSPWTDVYGRYFNRVRGRPRFISVLLYLNDKWCEKLGAPTKFYDPPTALTYEVFPRPGRCVMMDQDVMHTVVAPHKIAGNQPRYSLVWKLILHPKKEKQSMRLPSSKSIIRVGSANHGESK